MLLPEERLQAPDSPQSTPQTVTGWGGLLLQAEWPYG